MDTFLIHGLDYVQSEAADILYQMKMCIDASTLQKRTTNYRVVDYLNMHYYMHVVPRKYFFGNF